MIYLSMSILNHPRCRGDEPDAAQPFPKEQGWPEDRKVALLRASALRHGLNVNEIGRTGRLANMCRAYASLQSNAANRRLPTNLQFL